MGDLSGHGRARRRGRYCRVYSAGRLGPYPGGHDDERQVPESREEDHARDACDWHGFYLSLGGRGRGQVAEPILAAGLNLQLPVMLLHLVGGIVGYWGARALGFGETSSRTMAIETSTKSSAFGFLLAKLHFGAFAARVPSAVSVVWMALTGSSMAVAWRFMPVKPVKFDRSVKERFESVDLLTRAKKLFGKGK